MLVMLDEEARVAISSPVRLTIGEELKVAVVVLTYLLLPALMTAAIYQLPRARASFPGRVMIWLISPYWIVPAEPMVA